MRTIENNRSQVSSMKLTKVWVVILSMAFFSTLLSAQDMGPIPLEPVKGNEITFTRSKLLYGKVFYMNSSYNEKEIRKDFPPLDVLGTDFFSIRIDSQDKFAEIFKSVFPNNRLREMADESENITITILINNLAEPLMVCYTYDESSSITPHELELLEKGILSNINFTPYNIEVTGNASKFIDIRIEFDEIINGKIKDLILLEEAYQKHLRSEKW